MTEDKRLKQLRELGLTISYYRKLKGLTRDSWLPWWV